MPCARYVGRDLLEELQPFPAKRRFEVSDAGHVAARLIDRGDEALFDRVKPADDEDHGDCARLPGAKPRRKQA